MSYSVVLTAASGSVIIVMTIVRWDLSLHQQVTCCIYRAKSQVVQRNSLMLNLAISDLGLGEIDAV